jgi:hypothetical protein
LHKYLEENYGEFAADKLIPAFGIIPPSREFVKTTLESATVKGGIIFALRKVGLENLSSFAVDGIVVAGTGLGAFSSTAQILAYFNCFTMTPYTITLSPSLNELP